MESIVPFVFGMNAFVVILDFEAVLAATADSNVFDDSFNEKLGGGAVIVTVGANETEIAFAGVVLVLATEAAN